MTLALRALSLALAAGFAAPALACDELLTLDRPQVIDLVNRLRSTEADPLDQLFAFETLMCSAQAGVRDLTLRTAVASANPTIRGQVLLRALFEKEVIAVELLEVEGLTKEQYERIKANPVEALGVTYRDLPNACMSFHSDEQCPAYSSLNVQGIGATIHIRYNNYDVDGLFRLEGEGLAGHLTLGNLTYPARIALF